MTQPEDFEVFMKNYQNMVYSTAVRMLGNEADAEDISQEVFLKACERYEELSRSHRAGGWLKTVTKNLCLNHLSRYRSRWRFFSEMFHEETGEDYAATLPAPEFHEKNIAETEQRDTLETALKKLPAEQRVPLVLYHFEEMSYEEIARQLGISLSKVKIDIHRGREALRQKLKLKPIGDFTAAGAQLMANQPAVEANRSVSSS